MATAQAAVIPGLHEAAEVREVNIPDLADGAVLARVDAATLCGTDVHHWIGGLRASAEPHAYIPGHETAAIVEEVRGERRDVMGDPLSPGDRIIANYPKCGHCYFCTVTNQPQLCPNGYGYGHYDVSKYPYLLGGCAEYHYYPPNCEIVKVPDEVPSPLAASAACALRTVVHGYERLGGLEPHETVLVQGAGPLGLYAAALARDRGAGKVLVIGAPAARLKVAIAWGVDDTLDLNEHPEAADRRQWVMERTRGMGADVVLQCATGMANAESIDLIRRGGRFIAIGVGGGNISIPGAVITHKGLQVSGVIGAMGRHFWKALQFLATRSDRFPFERLLTGTYTLDQVTDALKAMEEFREVKPVILPRLPQVGPPGQTAATSALEDSGRTS